MNEEKTVAIIDIENGTAGVALARIFPNQAPKLFSEKRTILPIPRLLNRKALEQTIHRTVSQLLSYASEVATRIKNHPKTVSMGKVEQVVVFLRPPWIDMAESQGSFQLTATHSLLREVRKESQAIFQDAQISSHSFATAAASVIEDFYPQQTLMVTLTGEISEVTLSQNGMLEGYSTFPFGMHTSLRTLESHAGLTLEEAYSALKLNPEHLFEPIESAYTEFTNSFYHAAKEMIGKNSSAHVFVLAPEPFGDLFAHTIAEAPRIATLFKEESLVQALRTSHFSALLAAHGPSPDLFFMLEALFVNKRYGV